METFNWKRTVDKPGDLFKLIDDKDSQVRWSFTRRKGGRTSILSF